jgi:hypothetical protein
MYLESEALVRTMLALKDEGVPSLSVHDSLIVQKSRERLARSLLESNYRATASATPHITSDPLSAFRQKESGTAKTGRTTPEANAWTSRFASNAWKKLPTAVRLRWWSETAYSTVEPSADLEAAVRAVVEGRISPPPGRTGSPVGRP